MEFTVDNLATMSGENGTLRFVNNRVIYFCPGYPEHNEYRAEYTIEEILKLVREDFESKMRWD
jgi:hypothetical protein